MQSDLVIPLSQTEEFENFNLAMCQGQSNGYLQMKQMCGFQLESDTTMLDCC